MSLRQRSAQLAAAAAVLICLVGAWAAVRNPFGVSRVHSGRLISSASAGDGDSAQRPEEVSGAQRPDAVPADFHVWTASAPVKNTFFALGSVGCGAERCPAVVTSTDDGHHWHRVHTFTHTDTSAAELAAEPAVQPPGALSGLVFVSSRVGYVFGGDLWVTTDGGASFTHIAHPAATVLDVAVAGKNINVLTADGCVQGSCSGHLDLVRMPVGNRAPLPQPLAEVTPASAIYSASLAGSGINPVVLAQGAPGRTGNSPGAWHVTGASLSALSLRSLCHGNSVLAATTNSKAITALCDATPTATTTSYSTLSSSDGGYSWSGRGAGNLSLPTEGWVDLASDDGTHLVASTGGPRTAPDGTNRATTAGALAISADGGRSWHPPKTSPTGVNGGFDSLVPLGGKSMLALTRNGSTLWRSTDNGDTWHQLDTRHTSG